MALRLGAYVLPGDPVWLASSLSRYYDLLDDLVVLVPEGGTSWTGHELPVAQCLAIVDAVDTRRIARQVSDRWVNPSDPMEAETRQRQAGIEALGEVDWVLQIDNDEVLGKPESLLSAMAEAEAIGLDAVEWPMRCLFRQLDNQAFLEVVGPNLERRYDYPGSIAVRPGVVLEEARRVSADFLRVTVKGDVTSLQTQRACEVGEVRRELADPDSAILHNSWGRTPREIRRKMSRSGHQLGWRGVRFFYTRWLPSPLTWRWQRDVHPFAAGLWPRLDRVEVSDGLVLEGDRVQTKRLA